MTEISIREKDKWTNKGTDKQEMADPFLHNTKYWLSDFLLHNTLGHCLDVYKI